MKEGDPVLVWKLGGPSCYGTVCSGTVAHVYEDGRLWLSGAGEFFNYGMLPLIPAGEGVYIELGYRRLFGVHLAAFSE